MMNKVNMTYYLKSIITSILLIMDPVNGERNRYIRLTNTQFAVSGDSQKLREVAAHNFFNPIVHSEKRYLQEEDLFPNLVEYGSHYDTNLSMSMSMSMNLKKESYLSFPSKSPVSPVADNSVPSKAPIAYVSTKTPTASSANSDKPSKKPVTIIEESYSTNVPTSIPVTVSSNSTFDASSEVSGNVRKVGSKPATIASVVFGVMAIISAFSALIARKVHRRAMLSSTSEAKQLDAKGGHLDDTSTSSDTAAKSNMNSEFSTEGTTTLTRT